MKKSIYIPGIFHPLKVILVNYKELNTLNDEPDNNINGEYDNQEGTIKIVDSLSFFVKQHTLYHEISHHIDETLKTISDEENRCDILGSYLIALFEAKNKIDKFLK